MITGRKPLREYSLAITFDDGYRNGATVALPILRQHRAPATFFVATAYVEHRRPFWFDRLDYGLQNTNVHGRRFRLFDQEFCINASTRASLAESYRVLRHAAKARPISDLEFQSQMHALAECLEAEGGRALADLAEEDEWSAILTWAEAEKMVGCGACIGSHTVDHIRLGLVDIETARHQLVASKAAIEAHIHQPCLHLCYPNGSFNEHTMDLARDCGYASAVTTVEGFNSVGDDPMCLRRVNMPGQCSNAEFLAIVAGLSANLSRIKGLTVRLLALGR
jgi:peptidoglycan/xylan/chitin deacetylase (PgdA/CDA1 family)